MARGKFQPRTAPLANTHEIPGDDDAGKVRIDLDAADPDAFEVVEVDDTPEADKGKDSDWHGPSLADQEVDLRNLSAKKTVQRIERLRAETHTERRGREIAERERDAAVQRIQAQESEIQRLRLVTESGNNALVGSMRAERESRIADASRRLEQAHAEGNSAAIAKATADMGMAQAELVAINTRAPTPAAPAAPIQQQPVQQQAPRIAPRALDWVRRNSWFDANGADEKSREALHINETLSRQGVDPNSEAYTRELDKRLKAVYPDHEPFDEARSTPRRTNTVADGGRPNGSPVGGAPRTVELTSSQVALAKRLNVPLKEYAKSLQQYEAKLRGAQ
jgi:hypothetical protein